ncbi:IS66 family transposase [Sorangium sp. So ce1036]|uniref:IS66 family transposase n=1 Tax=Sorangium sp. So ce1036 TaxID=3133328 RepID=UPI003F108989
MERDWRDDRIEELEALVARLMRRVAELEAQLAQSSGNSSRPPSTDPPGAPPPSRPKRTGRRRGGQPGHEKHRRTLVPPEQVDKLQTCKPEACRRCGTALAGNDPDPHRHQVVEIPRAKATVEEFQLHALKCDRCGISTRATLPPGVPTSSFGPRLQALVAVLSGAYRLFKRAIDELVGDAFGVPIALGSVSNLEQATSEALAAPVEEIAQALPKESIVHMDETGWFEQSKRAWLWIAVTGRMALFAIRHSRGAHVAKELLGSAFSRILISDRWTAYAWVDTQRRQLCWAHLLRQFLGFQTHGAEASAIGRALELLTETMFHLWHRVRDGTMTRREFQKRMGPLRNYVIAHLREGAGCSLRAVAGRCREILELEPALWTFV